MIEQKQHIIDSCEKQQGFLTLEDGYVYFWVKDHGAMSADVLRIVADELDRRNFEWNKKVIAALSFV